MAIELNVKWGKEKLTVQADTNESPMLFKAELFSMTGVPPERQKTMFKGKQLADENWESFLKAGIKAGAQLMMLGSADKVPEAPAAKDLPKFADEMTDAEMAKALNLPAGLQNLGNTCYMNATLQCLKTIPELHDALQNFPTALNLTALASMNGQQDGGQAMTAVVRDLYKMMDSGQSGDNVVHPLIMLRVLHMCMPQFSEKDENGHLSQQDANEFWSALLQSLSTQNTLSLTTSEQKNVIRQYMQGNMDVTFKCKEAEDEPATQSHETFVQLECYVNQDTKYLQSGLRSRCNDEITKASPSLGRDAVYEKISRISRLPAYLAINMIRFQYKDDKKVSAKILKDVKFTMVLDMYDSCSDEHKAKLLPMRDRIKEAEDAELEHLKKVKQGEVEANAERNLVKLPTSFEDDPGSNNSGFYELRAILTHKGRSSNSGHYVAWIRGKRQKEPQPVAGSSNKAAAATNKVTYTWIKCDDDEISLVHEEDVMRLSGGGDWHCAYVLLYGPREVFVEQSDVEMLER